MQPPGFRDPGALADLEAPMCRISARSETDEAAPWDLGHRRDDGGPHALVPLRPDSHLVTDEQVAAQAVGGGSVSRDHFEAGAARRGHLVAVDDHCTGEARGASDESVDGVDEETSLIPVGGHGVAPATGGHLVDQRGNAHASQVGRLGGPPGPGVEVQQWIVGSGGENRSGVLPLERCGGLTPGAAAFKHQRRQQIDCGVGGGHDAVSGGTEPPWGPSTCPLTAAAERAS